MASSIRGWLGSGAGPCAVSGWAAPHPAITSRGLRKMNCMVKRIRRWGGLGLLLAVGLAPGAAQAQDDAGPPPIVDSTQVKQMEKYENLYTGQFTPGSGFDII